MKKAALPLHGLRMFEAVARHRSIKSAALELGVTPSAVSHQIAQLEERLDIRLFSRDGRSLALTREGRALLPKLSSGLDLIAEAVSDLEGTTTAGPLRISALETFALYWLMPRLRHFPAEDGKFSLTVSATQRVVGFEVENVDVAIRLGAGAWKNLEADELFADRLGLFVHPQHSGQRPDAIFLSAHRRADWNEWRRRFGSALAETSIVEVGSSSLAIKAASDGAGLCLASEDLVHSEVADGRLVPASEDRLRSAHGSYWLVYPRLKLRDPRVRHFREWMLGEAGGRHGSGAPAEPTNLEGAG